MSSRFLSHDSSRVIYQAIVKLRVNNLIVLKFKSTSRSKLDLNPLHEHLDWHVKKRPPSCRQLNTFENVVTHDLLQKYTHQLENGLLNT